MDLPPTQVKRSKGSKRKESQSSDAATKPSQKELRNVEKEKEKLIHQVDLEFRTYENEQNDFISHIQRQFECFTKNTAEMIEKKKKEIKKGQDCCDEVKKSIVNDPFSSLTSSSVLPFRKKLALLLQPSSSCELNSSRSQHSVCPFYSCLEKVIWSPFCSSPMLVLKICNGFNQVLTASTRKEVLSLLVVSVKIKPNNKSKDFDTQPRECSFSVVKENDEKKKDGAEETIHHRLNLKLKLEKFLALSSCPLFEIKIEVVPRSAAWFPLLYSPYVRTIDIEESSLLGSFRIPPEFSEFFNFQTKEPSKEGTNTDSSRRLECSFPVLSYWGEGSLCSVKWGRYFYWCKTNSSLSLAQWEKELDSNPEGEKEAYQDATQFFLFNCRLRTVLLCESLLENLEEEKEFKIKTKTIMTLGNFQVKQIVALSPTCLISAFEKKQKKNNKRKWVYELFTKNSQDLIACTHEELSNFRWKYTKNTNNISGVFALERCKQPLEGKQSSAAGAGNKSLKTSKLFLFEWQYDKNGCKLSQIQKHSIETTALTFEPIYTWNFSACEANPCDLFPTTITQLNQHFVFADHEGLHLLSHYSYCETSLLSQQSYEKTCLIWTNRHRDPISSVLSIRLEKNLEFALVLEFCPFLERLFFRKVEFQNKLKEALAAADKIFLHHLEKVVFRLKEKNCG